MTNYERAIVLDPSDSSAKALLSAALSMTGDYERANRVRLEAVRLDPLYEVASQLFIQDAWATRDDRLAEDLAKKFVLKSGPTKLLGMLGLWLLARERGDTAEMGRLAGLMTMADPLNARRYKVLLQAAKSEVSFTDAAKAIENEQARNPNTNTALLFYWIGDYDRFFDALEEHITRGVAPHFAYTWALAWRAQVINTDNNKRFKTIARKIGLVKYWKAHGWPDRCKPKGNDDFECE